MASCTTFEGSARCGIVNLLQQALIPSPWRCRAASPPRLSSGAPGAARPPPRRWPRWWGCTPAIDSPSISYKLVPPGWLPSRQTGGGAALAQARRDIDLARAVSRGCEVLHAKAQHRDDGTTGHTQSRRVCPVVHVLITVAFDVLVVHKEGMPRNYADSSAGGAKGRDDGTVHMRPCAGGGGARGLL